MECTHGKHPCAHAVDSMDMGEPSGQPNISCWRNTPVDKRWTDVPHYNMEIDRLFSLWEAPSGMGEPWKLVRAPLPPALHRAALFPASPRHPAVSRGAASSSAARRIPA